MIQKIDILTIRRATPNDALDIKQVHTKAYQDSYRGFLPDDFLDNIKIDDEIIDRTRNYLAKNECHVAVYKNKIVGFAYVSHQKDYFEINALYIHPEHQKQDIGSALINNITQEKHKLGYNKCIVWTMKFGPSLKFYEKQGFTTTSEEKVWKFNIPIIMLQKDLK